MANQPFHIILQIAGVVQLGMVLLVFISGRVTRKLDAVHILPPVHRQMCLAYRLYVAGTITALGLFCVFFPEDISSEKGLGRAVAIFGAIFWTGRVVLQFRYDINGYLRKKWMRVGYQALAPVFLGLAVVYIVAVF
ncbi:MAG: hypothetical protein AB7H80_07410 [Candidatus Kapaibacterium sp.]